MKRKMSLYDDDDDEDSLRVGLLPLDCQRSGAAVLSSDESFSSNEEEDIDNENAHMQDASKAEENRLKVQQMVCKQANILRSQLKDNMQLFVDSNVK